MVSLRFIAKVMYMRDCMDIYIHNTTFDQHLASYIYPFTQPEMCSRVGGWCMYHGPPCPPLVLVETLLASRAEGVQVVGKIHQVCLIIFSKKW